MTERAWLKYRLDVVSRWPESPSKQAVLTAIHARLAYLAQEQARRAS